MSLPLNIIDLSNLPKKAYYLLAENFIAMDYH